MGEGPKLLKIRFHFSKLVYPEFIVFQVFIHICFNHQKEAFISLINSHPRTYLIFPLPLFLPQILCPWEYYLKHDRLQVTTMPLLWKTQLYRQSFNLLIFYTISFHFNQILNLHANTYATFWPTTTKKHTLWLHNHKCWQKS